MKLAAIPLLLALPAAQAPAPAVPAAAGKPVCEARPLVARAELPDPRAFLMSLEVFRSEGMTVHVAGSKDRAQKYGFFLAFTVEGEPEPVWVKGSLGKKAFSLRGRPYSVETKLSLLHHERIRLIVRRETDGAVVADFTTGELAERVQETGPALTLLGREYRLSYSEDLRESGGAPRLLADRHTILLTTYETYRYDDGKTGYKFSQIPLQAEPLRQSMQPRAMGPKARGPRGETPVVFGFQLAGNELRVFDLTDYLQSGLPACPFAD